MSLDPTPSAATLRRMAAERENRGRARAASWPFSPPASPVEPRSPTPSRIDLTLPWSALQTGNRFFGLASKPYRAAKEKAGKLAAEQCGWLPHDPPRFTSPVRLVVTLHMPNEHRRDLLNYAKLIADALTGIVYRDDSQIHDARFVRAVDVDAPRALITVEAA